MALLHFTTKSLVAEPLKMLHVTKIETITVNCIKVNTLNHLKLNKFLSDIYADYGDMVMFTAVK